LNVLTVFINATYSNRDLFPTHIHVNPVLSLLTVKPIEV
jgi:hypothetical protein